MSDFDRIPALLAEIGADCPSGPSGRAWAELTFRRSRPPRVIVYSADPDEFQEQKYDSLEVHHITSPDAVREQWAAIEVIAGPAEDPIALLERALEFVRTETPVPL